MLNRTVLCLLAVVLCAGLLLAHGDPIMGTVTAVTADTFTINPTDGVSLEKDWAASGQGGVLWSPTTIRMALVQWRPDYAEPKALADLRVRQALAHGFDVPSVIETLNYGKGVQTPSVTIPTTAYYAQIDKAVTRYPYDAGQVAQLMVPSLEIRWSK